MKKILLSAAAIASMLFAASCQREALDPAQQEGDVVTATLNIEAPAMPDTKAIGDGQSALNLVFAVYDENGDELTNLRQGDWKNNIGDVTDEVHFQNLRASVTVKLVRGKEYTFVCWAQNKEAACYDFKDMKKIAISYDEYNASNNDFRDAFFASVQTGKVTANFSQVITLKRPFAQINVATIDYIAAEKAGLELNNLYSTVTVKNAATTLETFTGKATDAVEATFEYAAAPTEPLIINKSMVVNNPQTVIQDKYCWLAMNYILVADGTDNGASSAIANVAFEIREGASTVITSYDVPNVPVQRNYRTNIVGGLLTAEGTINIIIDPIFYGEYVTEVIY